MGENHVIVGSKMWLWLQLMFLLLATSTGLPSPPDAQELVSVDASRTGNMLRKMTSGVEGEMEGLVKDINDEKSAGAVLGQKSGNEMQQQIDALTAHINDNQSRLNQFLQTIVSADQTISGIQKKILEFQSATKAIETDKSLRERIEAKRKSSLQRSEDYKKNSLVVEQWAVDFQDYVSQMLLPGSMTNPGKEAHHALVELREAMDQGAKTESNLAAEISDLMPNIQSNGDTQFREAALTEQMNQLIDERANATAAVEHLLLVTHAAQDRLHQLLLRQYITTQTFQEHSRSLDTHLDMYANIANNLREFRKNLCPHVCSGNGKCVDTECVCDENFEGTDCSRVVGAKEPQEPLATTVNGTTTETAANSSAQNVPERYAFDFGRSTHTFVASDELSCPKNFTQITTSVWLQPRGGGMGATVVSYATATQQSEWLLWLDEDCQTLFLWVNTLQHPFQNMGVPVANFSTYPLCDGRWHHVVVTWDGVAGNSRSFVDGRFWENHWNVFMGEQVKSGGRVVLGHNQVQLEPRNRNGIIPDAFLGVMSDFFFLPNTIPSPADIQQLFQNNAVSNSQTISPFIHWSFNNNPNVTSEHANSASGAMTLVDEGSMHVNAMAFGGSWVKAGNRKCGDLVDM